MHLRCPHCRVAIELLNDEPPETLSCPACGVDFSASDENTIIADVSVSDGSDSPVVDAPDSLADFELMAELGVGAFGSVWKARDKRLGRLVAIKKPRTRHAAEAQTQTFLAEAQATAALRHHHIVTVYDVLRDGGLWYIVSDFVDGRTVKEVLADGPMSESHAITLTLKVAEALHYAHEMGIIHRDLKPANIMVDSSGEPRVMDFGLAKRDATEFTVSREGIVLGTPAYMSPEQARGDSDHADRRSDVYSLGVILYELVTGSRPFDGKQQLLLQQVMDEEPRSPRDRNPSISRDLETLCLKCLQKRPDQRFATAQDLANELRRMQLGEPIRSRPVSSLERLMRWAKRKPVVAGLTSLLLLVLIASASVFAIQQFQKAKLEEGISKLEQSESEARSAESQARTEVAATQVQLTRKDIVARSRRLAERAADLRIASPVLSMLLAAEAVDEVRQNGVAVTPAATAALYASLEATAGVPMIGHSGPVQCTAILPGGERAVTGSDDTTVRVWDLDSLQPQTIHLLEGHHYGVSSMAVSGDGRWLATAAIRPEAGPDAFLSGPFTDEESFGDNNAVDVIRLWDLNADDPAASVVELSGHEVDVTRLAMSPNGKWLASGDLWGAVRVWNLQARDVLRSSVLFSGHTQLVTALVFDPFTDRLASTSTDGSIRLWDLRTRNQADRGRALAGHPTAVRGAVFDSLGETLLTVGDDKTMRAWSTDSFAPQPVDTPILMEGHTAGIRGIAIDSGGFEVATFNGGGMFWFGPAELRLWDLLNDGKDGGKQIYDGTTGSAPTAVAFGNNTEVLGTDGWLAASCTDGVVRVWDTFDPEKTLCELRGHEGALRTLAISPDGRRLIAGGQNPTPRLWHMNQGDPRTAAFVVRSEADLSEVVVDSRCQFLVVTELGGQSELWSLAIDQDEPLRRSMEGINADIEAIESSPDDRWLATTDSDGGLHLWDLQQPGTTIKAITLLESDSEIDRMLFDQASRWLITTDAAGIVEFRDLSPDGTPGTLIASHELMTVIRDIGLSRDASRLIVVAEDQSVHILERLDNLWSDPRKLNEMAAKTYALLSPDWLELDTQLDELRLLKLSAESIDEAVLRLPLANDQTIMFPLAITKDWFLAEGFNHAVVMCDLRPNRQNITVHAGHRDSLIDGVMSAEHGIAVTRSEDGEVRLWHLPNAGDSEVTAVAGLLGKHRSDSEKILISPDLKLILAGSDRTIRMWDLRAAQPAVDPIVLRTFGEPVELLGLNPAGRWLITDDIDTTRLWDRNLDRVLNRVRRIAGRELTDVERMTYSRLSDADESKQE